MKLKAKYFQLDRKSISNGNTRTLGPLFCIISLLNQFRYIDVISQSTEALG